MMNRNKIEEMLENGITTIEKLEKDGIIKVSVDSSNVLIKRMFIDAGFTIGDIATLIAESDNISKELQDFIYFCDEYSEKYELYYIVDEVKDFLGF